MALVTEERIDRRWPPLPDHRCCVRAVWLALSCAGALCCSTRRTRWHTPDRRSCWRWSRPRSSRPATRRRPCSPTTTSSRKACARWRRTSSSAQCSVAENGASMRVDASGVRARWQSTGSIHTGKQGHKHFYFFDLFIHTTTSSILAEASSVEVMTMTEKYYGRRWKGIGWMKSRGERSASPAAAAGAAHTLEH